MASQLIQPMPPFDPDAEIGVNIAPRWHIWLEDFQMYLVATGITDKKKKRALLLYQAGPKVREIFRQIPENGNDDDFDKAIELLNTHFEQQKHRLYDVYEFRQAKQGSAETLDQYYTRLRTWSKRCDFADADFEIMLQIVLYGTSSRLRKQARHIEEDKQELQREDTNINFVKAKASANTCRNCGEEWPHAQGPCPAKGKQCRNCNKFNHFAKLFRSPRANIRQGHTSKQNQPRRRDNIRPVQTAEDKLQSSSESSESDYCYAVNTNYNKAPTTKLKINGKNVKFTVDTGSTINIIDENTFRQLQNINLQKTHVRAYPFNSSKPVQMTGKFDTLIESRKRLTIATIYVTAQDGSCLLSNTTAQELGLISLHLNQIDTRTKASRKDKGTGLSTIKDEKVKNILHKHSKVFQGVGKLNN